MISGVPRASLSVVCVYYPRLNYVHIVIHLLTIRKKALIERIMDTIIDGDKHLLLVKYAVN